MPCTLLLSSLGAEFIERDVVPLSELTQWEGVAYSPPEPTRLLSLEQWFWLMQALFRMG